MNTPQHAPATGTHTTNGTPHGYSSLTPFLAVDGAASALEFYQYIFGAELVNPFRFGDAIVQAELQLPNGRFQLGAAQPDHQLVAPTPTPIWSPSRSRPTVRTPRKW